MNKGSVLILAMALGGCTGQDAVSDLPNALTGSPKTGNITAQPGCLFLCGLVLRGGDVSDDDTVTTGE
jgi:hypothetical protein